MSDNDNKMTSQQLHLQLKQSPVFAARKRDQESRWMFSPDPD